MRTRWELEVDARRHKPDRFATSPASQIRRNFIDKASALLALKLVISWGSCRPSQPLTVSIRRSCRAYQETYPSYQADAAKDARERCVHADRAKQLRGGGHNAQHDWK